MSLTATRFSKTLWAVISLFFATQQLAAQSCTAINLPTPAGWTPQNFYTGATVGADGWINGVNVYLDKEKAMYFDASAITGDKVQQVYIAFGFAYSATPSKIVPVRIYDGTSGTPGAQIGTTNLTMDQIMTDVAGGLYTVAEFATPVTLPVSKQFFVSVDLTNLCWGSGCYDTLSIVSNANGETTPSAIWEKQSNNVWYQYNTPGSWPLDASLFVHPFITDQPTVATFTASNTTVCSGSTISFDATGSTGQDTLVWFFEGGTPNIVLTNTTPTIRYDTAGTYNAYLLVVGGGCSLFAQDSLTITVNQSPSVTLSALDSNFCAGGSTTLTATGVATSYTWNPTTALVPTTGPIVTASTTDTTTYSVIATALNGCTDTASLTLNVGAVVTPSISISPIDPIICGSQPVTFVATYSGGGTSPQFGWGVNSVPFFVNSDTFVVPAPVDGDVVNGVMVSSDACATTPTAISAPSTITVLAASSDTSSYTICQGDSVQIEGVWRSTAGTFVNTYTSSNGCDSTIVSILTVNPTYNQTASLTLCNGDSAFLAGAWQTVAGTYTDVFISSLGCDSSIATTLSFIAAFQSSRSVSLCPGDSVFAAGAWQTATGVYVDTFASTGGCDSIVTTTVTANPGFTFTASTSICQGDSVFLAGNWQTTGGVYRDTFTAVGGCDSIIVTTLTVNPSYNQVATVNLCQGDSVFVGGAWQFSSGVFVDTFSTVNGCDSIIATSVNVQNRPQRFTQLEICEGDSVFIAGAWRFNAGNFQELVPAPSGCDSLLTYTLNVYRSYTITNGVFLCAGDSVFAGGAWQTTSGLYYDNYQTVRGCDSTIVTVLTVYQAGQQVTIGVPLSACLQDTDIVLTGFPAGGFFTGVGVFDSLLSPGYLGDTGTIEVAYWLYDSTGCASHASALVTIINCDTNGTGLNEWAAGINVYPNPSTGMLTVDLQGLAQCQAVVTDLVGREVALLTLNEGKNALDLSHQADGVYIISLRHEGLSKNVRIILSR
ncbi:MAG: T9SS type A sorting domain-containing protein [Chitinophagales bacterium]|nr:T9SS type A sorting domain-containing protein [Chitinophagales bacterium]